MTRKIEGNHQVENPGNGTAPVADSESLEKLTHDFRSSVNIIIGYAQLMLDETTGKINATQRQALQDILNSSNKLGNLADVISQRLEPDSENNRQSDE